ncbi:MAG: rRNA maturation RNase YbeY [Alphaproteobacteria bacterium]|nr:rRNA maturation RNase YbeY [Alphaproteobacteria bacterium]
MIEVEIEDAAWTSAEPDAEALARAAGQAVLRHENQAGGAIVLLTDDDAVRDLNARFRGQDKPTNVLSFPAAANQEHHLGDVALAYGVCAREAVEQGKTLGQHLQHLVAHGVLHLLGYDHMSDPEAQEMEGLERVVLAGLGVPDPYAPREGDHG